MEIFISEHVNYNTLKKKKKKSYHIKNTEKSLKSIYKKNCKRTAEKNPHTPACI